MRGGSEAGELVASELHGVAVRQPDGIVDAIEDVDEEQSLHTRADVEASN
jgi:hypothetical protein